MGASNPTLATVEFEVYGQVQGCYFPKYCKELAEQLGIGGWVKNTKKGTIVGKIQGNKAELDHILEAFCSFLYDAYRKGVEFVTGTCLFSILPLLKIDWLSTKGSPGCKIEKCDLTNWEYVARIAYTDFSIRF